jgi:TPR repeat protein
MKRYIILIVVVLISSNVNSQSVEEINDESKRVISNQKFEEAIPLLQKAAKMGSPEAQYNLGICYQYGYGLEKNDSLATDCYKQAAKMGWKDAQYKMSYAYINGNGIEKSKKKAFEYALLCANQEDIECIFNIINCYKDGIGTEKDSTKVLEWAIKLGTIETPENLKFSGKITSVRLNLAHMYYKGDEVEKNLIKSYTWFLIYNESKRDFSVRVQEQQIQIIKDLEDNLTDNEKEKAVKLSEELLGRKLKNIAKLHQWNK